MPTHFAVIVSLAAALSLAAGCATIAQSSVTPVEPVPSNVPSVAERFTEGRDADGRNELLLRACATGDRPACRELRNSAFSSVEAQAYYFRALCLAMPLHCDKLAALYRDGVGVGQSSGTADKLDVIRRAAMYGELTRRPELVVEWSAIIEEQGADPDPLPQRSTEWAPHAELPERCHP